MRALEKATGAAVLAITLLIGMGMPVAYAHPVPPGDRPLVQECDHYAWNTVATISPNPSHSSGNVTYTLKIEVQQGWDATFGVWCQDYSTLVSLWNNNSSSGTLYAKVAICGGSTYQSSSGNFSGTYSSTSPFTVRSPTLAPVPATTAQGESRLVVTGGDWTDGPSSCGGHI
jgi:hypothetical protein